LPPAEDFEPQIESCLSKAQTDDELKGLFSDAKPRFLLSPSSARLQVLACIIASMLRKYLLWQRQTSGAATSTDGGHQWSGGLFCHHPGIGKKTTPVGFKHRITQTSSLPGHAFDQRNNR
jgi:hypothetical protein